MRRLRSISMLILLFSFIQATAHADRWALLIGINKYNSPDIRDLRGCETDVELMADVLTKKFGFSRENMKILRSQEATREAILKNLRTWLIEKPKSGDVVVFYFSGHGSRVVDESGDEPDGWDEILCPVDLTPSATRERFINGILDDELGELLEEIPTDNVTVIFDSCHSGTATKSLSLLTDAGQTVSKQIEPTIEMFQSRDLVLKQRNSSKPPGKTRESISVQTSNEKHVFISGSAAEEVSLDAIWAPSGGQSFFAGVLTKNLVEMLHQAEGDMSYADLKPEVLKRVKQRSQQTPQFEGAIQRSIFSTLNPEGVVAISTEPAKPFVLVTKVEGNQVTISAGSSRGVTEGSIYHIFSPSERAFAGNPNATLQIVSVSTTQASGNILKSQVSIVPMCRAVEVSHAHRPDKLYLQIPKLKDGIQQTRLAEAFAQIDNLVVVNTGQYADVILDLQIAPGSFTGTLVSNDGVELDKVTTTNAAALANRLRPKLENAFIVKKLTQLRNPAPPFKVAVWVEGKGERPIYRIGEVAQFNFRAERNCYLTLLNVDTQGKVTMLFPNQYHPSNEILANVTYTIPSEDMKFRIRAQGPPGKEMIKAIATTTPVEIDEFDLKRTTDIFLSVGGVNEVSNFTKSLGRAFVVEEIKKERPENTEETTQETTQETTHLPTSKWVTNELITEIVRAGNNP